MIAILQLDFCDDKIQTLDVMTVMVESNIKLLLEYNEYYTCVGIGI